VVEPYFSGVDPCFRGMINVLWQSSGVNAVLFYSVFRGLRGEKKRHVLTTGGDTVIIGNSPVYREAF